MPKLIARWVPSVQDREFVTVIPRLERRQENGKPSVSRVGDRLP
jgi:hypothetical protein